MSHVSRTVTIRLLSLIVIFANYLSAPNLVYAQHEIPLKVTTGGSTTSQVACDLPHRSQDVKRIVDMLLGGNGGGAFATKGWGGSQRLVRAKDLIIYSDVSGVDYPKAIRAVPYDFIQARMRHLKSGGKASPAIIITKSVPEDPPEKRFEGRQTPKNELGNERCYYVEVGISKIEWLWMKIVVRERDGKVEATGLWVMR